MTHYTTAVTSGPYNADAVPENLTVWVNGGTVTLEVQVSDTQWITQKTYNADASEKIEVAGTTIRLTPSGGAEFNFGQGI